MRQALLSQMGTDVEMNQRRNIGESSSLKKIKCLSCIRYKLLSSKGRRQGWFDPGTTSGEYQTKDDLEGKKRCISLEVEGYVIETCSRRTALSGDTCLKLKIRCVNI